MTSRLDRLVTLLETGSTQLIRNTAAQQLADIQKKHPDELFNLLTRVAPFLKSRNWDTRIAAAKALAGIVENAERFDPNALDGDIELDDDEAAAATKLANGARPSDDQLSLETLDTAAILSHGKTLVGSAGKQYDYNIAKLDPAERLAYQKKSLAARLGLGGEYTEADLIDESDVRQPEKPVLSRLNTLVDRSSGSGGASPVDQTPVGEQSLSKRQLNMLKRKNKRELKGQANKVRIVDLRRPSIQAREDSPQPTAVKLEPPETNGHDAMIANDLTSIEPSGGDDTSKLITEFKGPAMPIKSELQPEIEEEGVEWPYERLCEYLMVDMFDPSWETRHGAAMGIRDIIRVHGAGAGREQGQSRVRNDELNQKWLDDLACRLCCIFMLDRFGDYVSDTVVAPVRETAGQALGATLQFLSPSSVTAVFRILHSLVMQFDVKPTMRIWQSCHGGMIGMRYLVAVRGDQLLADEKLVDGVLEAVMMGLGDWDDDVRAVSAATLLPVSSEFINLRPQSLSKLLTILWDCLSNLSDDLSASTGSVMDLLAKLCSMPEVLEVMKSNASQDANQSFTNLVPRLFPFLRHTITSVRSAVLRAFLTFLDLPGSDTKGWVDAKALTLIFQNLLVERNEAVLRLSLRVWIALLDVYKLRGIHLLADELGPHLRPLLTIALHPIGVSRFFLPMDQSLFIRPSGQPLTLPDHMMTVSPPQNSGTPPAKKRRRSKTEREITPPVALLHNIDGPMVQGDIDLVGMETLIRSRLVAAEALGKLMNLWPASLRSTAFEPSLSVNLRSPYASTRSTAAAICEEYAKSQPQDDALSPAIVDILRGLIEEEQVAYYADIKVYLIATQSYCTALRNTFIAEGRLDRSHLPQMGANPQVEGEDWNRFSFSLAQAEAAIGDDFNKLKQKLNPANRISATPALNDAKRDVHTAIDEAQSAKASRDMQVKAAAAAALVALNQVPKKASTTIKALMDSVKGEENIEVQKRSAAAIVLLIQQMVLSGKKVVVDKVVGNLVKFYCADASETPEFHYYKTVSDGVLSLRKDEDITDREDPVKFEREAKAARLQRRGAREALEQLSVVFGANLFKDVPILASLLEDPLKQVFSGDIPGDLQNTDNELGQQAIDSMSTIRAMVPSLDKGLHQNMISLLPHIIKALKSPLAVFRYTAAKCLATICSTITVEGFTSLIKEVLPCISNALEVNQRQGAIETVYHLIHTMEDGILPYVIFLIVPVLGRMSDSDSDVRLIATTAFATLVKLVPLEAGIPDPPGLSEELLQGRERERKFMAQMLDFKKVEPFEIPVAIKATLRSYQQEGVNWLAFLNRYHLHGILCDDMGLGKTLQTLCIVASDHHMRAEEFAQSQNPDSRKLPSLIVCPPTLSGHWQQEIAQYAPFLTKIVAYVGSPTEREKRRHLLKDADIVITSYDVCRNDIATLLPIPWNYAVLDEGHLIKNPATKTTLAVKRLSSNHRLILSGTPIQNNVLELWSLFDFLMPGFLGTEKVFKDRFAKPIAASRYGKASTKEQEAGALAAEQLHKQVLPFLLRRLKEEVLDDLPPKIVQNYYCDLSDLQRQLFADFNKAEGKAISAMATNADKEAKKHIFTALNYMRKLCNSPALVVKPEHKQYAAIQAQLAAKRSSLSAPEHAPKVKALRDLLIDCGIGTSSIATNGPNGVADESALTSASAVSQHRALIFCQMKEMLDILVTSIFSPAGMLPGATYMRLDGNVPGPERQAIVNKFNSDPSIDCLLLTTSVGGLGLNLTGADTVIFVEHDWNPARDVQAMDRAHRIGQRKVVNVHRLITRGTLEEKILSLQRFKIDVASTVVSQQSAGLAGMQTDQILDLFSFGEGGEGEVERARKDDGDGAVDEVTGEIREKGKKGLLDDLGEVWDEKQYEEEYNLDEYLKKMKT